MSKYWVLTPRGILALLHGPEIGSRRAGSRSRRALVTYAAIATVAVALVRTPAAAETVAIPFKAANGDAFHVRVTKTVFESENGKDSNEGPFSFDYDGAVLDASESGYRMRWTLKSVFMPGTKAENRELSSGMLALMRDIPLEFDASSNGVPVRIPNFRNLIPRLVEVGRDVLTAQGRKPDQQVLDRMEQTYRNMSPQAAAATFLPEAAFVGAMQNLTLDTDAPKKTEHQSPSPFGGGSIKTVTEIRLTKHDADNQFAIIEWKTRFDRDAMAAMVKTMIESAAPAGKQLPPEALQMMSGVKLERNDEGTALVSLADGWIRKIHYRQLVSNELMGKSKKKDETWLIEIDRVTN